MGSTSGEHGWVMFKVGIYRQAQGVYQRFKLFPIWKEHPLSRHGHPAGCLLSGLVWMEIQIGYDGVVVINSQSTVPLIQGSAFKSHGSCGIVTQVIKLIM